MRYRLFINSHYRCMRLLLYYLIQFFTLSRRDNWCMKRGRGPSEAAYVQGPDFCAAPLISPACYHFCFVWEVVSTCTFVQCWPDNISSCRASCKVMVFCTIINNLKAVKESCLLFENAMPDTPPYIYSLSSSLLAFVVDTRDVAISLMSLLVSGLCG